MTREIRPAVESQLSPVTFQNAQDAFLLRCRAQNLSPLTIGWYKGILKALGVFLEAHGIEHPKDVTPTPSCART